MASNLSHASGMEPEKSPLESSAKSDNRKANNIRYIQEKVTIHANTHFSSVLFSGDFTTTLLELVILSFLGSVAFLHGENLNVAGSMTFREVTYLLLFKS